MTGLRQLVYRSANKRQLEVAYLERQIKAGPDAIYAGVPNVRRFELSDSLIVVLFLGTVCLGLVIVFSR